MACNFIVVFLRYTKHSCGNIPAEVARAMYLDRNDLDNESLDGHNRKCEKNPGRPLAVVAGSAGWAGPGRKAAKNNFRGGAQAQYIYKDSKL